MCVRVCVVVSPNSAKPQSQLRDLASLISSSSSGNAYLEALIFLIRPVALSMDDQQRKSSTTNLLSELFSPVSEPVLPRLPPTSMPHFPLPSPFNHVQSLHWPIAPPNGSPGSPTEQQSRTLMMPNGSLPLQYFPFFVPPPILPTYAFPCFGGMWAPTPALQPTLPMPLPSTPSTLGALALLASQHSHPSPPTPPSSDSLSHTSSPGHSTNASSGSPNSRDSPPLPAPNPSPPSLRHATTLSPLVRVHLLSSSPTLHFPRVLPIGALSAWHACRNSAIERRWPPDPNPLASSIPPLTHPRPHTRARISPTRASRCL